MKPAPFSYFAPGSLEEAVGLLSQHGEEAKVLAGGQSLVPMMAFRLATPSVLIDLNGVAELDHQRLEGDTLVLGALSRHRAVAELGLRGRCEMLAEGIDLIGHPAIRNRGTVGGSLAHADPAAEWPAILLALGGEVDVIGPRGRRTIDAPGLFVSYFTTSLAPDEILAEVRLPLPNGGRVRSTFLEFSQRHGDFALVGVAALAELDGDGSMRDARLALIGVADRPVRAQAAEAALRGRQPTEEVLDEAAHAAVEEIDPVSDVHGSATYRRHVAKVLVRRALASIVR
jgi:carbon-monoxide dehydrogenase medium subunit